MSWSYQHVRVNNIILLLIIQFLITTTCPSPAQSISTDNNSSSPTLKIAYLSDGGILADALEGLGDYLALDEAFGRALADSGYSGVELIPHLDARALRGAFSRSDIGAIFGTPALLRFWDRDEWRIVLQERRPGDIWDSRPDALVQRPYIIFASNSAVKPENAKWVFNGSEDDASFIFPHYHAMQQMGKKHSDIILKSDPFDVFASVQSGIRHYGALSAYTYQAFTERVDSEANSFPVPVVIDQEEIEELGQLTVPTNPVFFSNVKLSANIAVSRGLSDAIMGYFDAYEGRKIKFVAANSRAYLRPRETILHYFSLLADNVAGALDIANIQAGAPQGGSR